MVKAQSLHKVLIDLKKVTSSLSLTMIPEGSWFARGGWLIKTPQASRFAREGWLKMNPKARGGWLMETH